MKDFVIYKLKYYSQNYDEYETHKEDKNINQH